MPALSLLALVAFLAGCGASSSTPQRPEIVRQCGELEGVEPVDPVIVGSYPVPTASGGTADCPMFAPVPCTSPKAEYVPLCGEECFPQTAEGADGDTWVVGCAWRMRGIPTSGADWHHVQCSYDPYDGGEYWFEFFESSPVFAPVWQCWVTCDDGEPYNEPAEWCPIAPTP